MAKHVMIIESPNKIKTIAQYIGQEDFQLIATYGHLRDLSKTGMGFDKDLNPNWVDSNFKKRGEKISVLGQIKKAAKEAEHIYLATDPDREGEAISWHVWSLLDAESQKKCQRIVFNEITKPAIQQALSNPRDINFHQIDSYLARRLLDREFGFKLSGFARSYLKGHSAGRVQSVALRFLVERDQQIAVFVPEYWFNVDAFILKGDVKLALRKLAPEYKNVQLNHDLKNGMINFKLEHEAQEVLQSLNHEFVLSNIEPFTFEKSNPPQPFKTSTLQRVCISQLKMSSQAVEKIAQILYEGVEGIQDEPISLISYPRTDQTVLSETFKETAYKFLKDNYGDGYFTKKSNLKAEEKEKSLLVQGAHEGIRPTDINLTPNKVKPYLKKREYEVYALIWLYAVASLMQPSIYKVQRFFFTNNGHEFVTRTRVRDFDGYEKLFSDQGFALKSTLEKNVFALNECKVNQVFSTKNKCVSSHNSKPPSQYNQATLIQALEQEGIGRPSTYSSIVVTVLNRSYATLTSKALTPTEKGTTVANGLIHSFPKIMSFDYTRKMEENLDRIALGELNWKEFLKPTFQEFEDQLKFAKNNTAKPELEKVGQLCPDCNSELVYRIKTLPKKELKFIGCSNFPKCKYVKSLTPPPEVLIDSCPNCGSDLYKRVSYRKQTPFAGCSSFPKCKFIESWDSYCKRHNLEVTTTNYSNVEEDSEDETEF